MCGGVGHMGRYLNTWEGVQTDGGPPHPPITCRYPLEHTDAQGSIGDMEVFEPMGASKCMGASKHMGHIQKYGGTYRCPPSVKHTCH